MKIMIQNSSLNYELTKQLLEKLGNSYEINIYDKYGDVSNIFLNIWDNFNMNFENYKTNLEIRNNYLFIKKWTNLIVEDERDFTSFEIYKKLGYEVYNVKIWMNCNLWCKYCYLLSSTKFNPELTIYWNIKEEVRQFMESNKDKKIVLNIWEYTDSFLYDKITNLSSFFNELCLEYPNLLVESRTKLTNLQLNLNPNKNFILWFSVSINEMDNFWKRDLIIKKLEFISHLTKLWYKVALKFDPIITLDWYDDDFFEVIKSMNKENIHHFSIWCLRFSKWLWKIIWKCTNTKSVKWDFETVNWKYVNRYRECIYNFFIKKMETIWVYDYYLSMDPK